MFVWRNAIILGLIFMAVGLLYLFVQGDGSSLDRAGVTMLLILGIAMGFVFSILLRGSREL